MTFPTPQVDFSTFIDTLNLYLERDDPPSEMDVKRLKIQAAKLGKTDRPYLGVVAESGIAALLWDQDEVLRISELADRIYGDIGEVLRNVSVSLRHVNLIENAIEYSKRAYEIDPLSYNYLDGYVQDLLVAAEWSKAREILGEYISRTGHNVEEFPALEDYRNFVLNELAKLHYARISEDTLHRELKIALQVLANHKVRARTLDVEVISDPDGCTWLDVAYTFIGDINLELRLGSELANQLSELNSWDPTKLSVGFSYLADAKTDALIPA